jgi:hypothetical protein
MFEKDQSLVARGSNFSKYFPNIHLQKNIFQQNLQNFTIV